MTIRRLSPVLGLIALGTLAACSSGDAEAPVYDGNESDNVVEVMDETPLENIVEPEPTPTPTPEPIAAPALPDEEQIMEDAESVGMTARVPRGDAMANEAAPVQ